MKNQAQRDRAMLRACREFVAFKDRLDADARLGAHLSSLERLSRYIRCLRVPDGRDWTAAAPTTFCSRALPFSMPHMSSTSTKLTEFIDPHLVVSGSYRGYTPPSDPNELMDWSDERALRDAYGDNEVPKYAQIGTLPLYVAIEGKNRVEVFKRHRAQMRAVVFSSAFPAASELRIIPLRPFALFALAKENDIQVIPFPEVTVRILKAYGVKMAAPQWQPFAVRQLWGRRREICASQMRA